MFSKLIALLPCSISPNSDIPATENVKIISKNSRATFAILFIARYKVIKSCYNSLDDLIIRSRRATLMILNAVRLKEELLPPKEMSERITTAKSNLFQSM